MGRRSAGHRVWRELAPQVWTLATVQVFSVKERAEAYAMQLSGRVRVWPASYSPPGCPAAATQAVRQGVER